jgi:SAM-dependent methyltransferase
MIINDVYKPELVGDSKFDLACAFHIMDHLTDPEEALLSLGEGLKPGGHVLIVCHDVESWTAKLLGSHSPIFDVEHVYLFSQSTMALLMRSTGFEVIEVGSLSNRYPLGYWMRMLPLVSTVVDLLPKFITNADIDIKAGNLYALGKKSRPNHVD